MLVKPVTRVRLVRVLMRHGLLPPSFPGAVTPKHEGHGRPLAAAAVAPEAEESEEASPGPAGDLFKVGGPTASGRAAARRALLHASAETTSKSSSTPTNANVNANQVELTRTIVTPRVAGHVPTVSGELEVVTER